MTPDDVIKSFENAWRGLATFYEAHPSENTRTALNMLSKIIGKVKSEIEKEKSEQIKEQKRIELEQWIAWFEEGE